MLALQGGEAAAAGLTLIFLLLFGVVVVMGFVYAIILTIRWNQVPGHVARIRELMERQDRFREKWEPSLSKWAREGVPVDFVARREREGANTPISTEVGS